MHARTGRCSYCIFVALDTQLCFGSLALAIALFMIAKPTNCTFCMHVCVITSLSDNTLNTNDSVNRTYSIDEHCVVMCHIRICPVEPATCVRLAGGAGGRGGGGRRGELRARPNGDLAAGAGRSVPSHRGAPAAHPASAQPRAAPHPRPHNN